MMDIEKQKRKAISSLRDLKNALDAIENELGRDFVSSIYVNEKADIIERRATYLKTLF